MKRTRLQLTGIGSVLTQEAEKKLETQEDYQIPTCSNGKTVEFYDDIGIPIPEDLVEKLKKQGNGIELEDKDFESTYSEVVVYEDQIKFIVTDDELTTIFLTDGFNLTVTETADEINEYLNYIEMNRYYKIYYWFMSLLKISKQYGESAR